MGGKPATPKPTAQELELQRSQRSDINDQIRDSNTSLKALKRTLGGRRGLLGSGSELGIGVRPRGGGSSSSGNSTGLGISGAGGGIMSGGGSASSGGGRAGGGNRGGPRNFGGGALR